MVKKYLQSLQLKKENQTEENKYDNCVKIHFNNDNVCFSTENVSDFVFKTENSSDISIKDLHNRITELENCIQDLLHVKNCDNIKNLCNTNFYEVSNDGKIIIKNGDGFIVQ